MLVTNPIRDDFLDFQPFSRDLVIKNIDFLNFKKLTKNYFCKKSWSWGVLVTSFFECVKRILKFGLKQIMEYYDILFEENLNKFSFTVQMVVRFSIFRIHRSIANLLPTNVRSDAQIIETS